MPRTAIVALSSPAGFRSSRARVWPLGVAAVALALVLPVPGSGATPAAATATTARTLLSVIDPAGSAASVAAGVRARGGQVVAVFEVAGALLVDLPAGALAPAGTVAVPDVPMRTNAVRTVSPTANLTYRTTLGLPGGLNGSGVTVAVVDTGVADVPDLAGRVTHVNVSGGPQGDGYGHGTFLAGLVAGDGTSSGGTYQGVAPAAKVLDVQVAKADGSTSLSTVLAGLQAVADRRATDPSLKVLSLALSTGSPLPPLLDPLSRGLDRLWSSGLTVVVAAGNEGPAQGTVSSPGNDPTLITVGALDEHGTAARSDDDVADFSSRGAAIGTKPDLVAPGVSLISTNGPGSIAVANNPGSITGDAYMHGSGTSMAEAVVAGASAVLYQARMALTPDTVKRLLTSTAYQSALLPAADAGAGGLDLAAAVAAAPKARLLTTKPWRGQPAADPTVGPAEKDEGAWADFTQAWAAGNLQDAADAWANLAPKTRRWAASAFAVALVSAGLNKDDAEYGAILAAARRWLSDGFTATSWDNDAWVARRWLSDTWSARRWLLEDWTARRWLESDWTARRWLTEAFADASWTAATWTTEDWLAFAWSARRWLSTGWAGDAWVLRSWTARRWLASDFEDWGWSARRWLDDGWTARRWLVTGWSSDAGPAS